MTSFNRAIQIFRLPCLIMVGVITSQAWAADPLPKKICAIYPHLKDSYWLSVNYGMVEEARLQGINLKVLESGGYPNTQKQVQQIESCRQWNADAIILGTVSPTLYFNQLSRLTGNIPVFITVNHLDVGESDQASVKGIVGVDWHEMGLEVGEYLAKKHPKGSGKKRVLLLPGPQASGGTKPVVEGFLESIIDADIEVVVTLWADNDKEKQRNLFQQVIDDGKIDYVVGSAVAIEAAISEIRSAQLDGQIGLVSTYLSHGVYRGLLRGRVEFAPTDKMALQGRLSIRQAVNFLNQVPYEYKIEPTIDTLTPNTINEEAVLDSLSPSKYRPTFNVESN